MYDAMTFAQLADKDVEEFEGDLKRYQAANRRSVLSGLLVVTFGLLLACMVCSAVFLLAR